MRGFKNAYWLGNRATGEVLIVTLYEDEASLRASEPQVNEMRSRGVQEMGATLESAEVYEVLADA